MDLSAGMLAVNNNQQQKDTKAMTNNEIINHPDSHLFITINHSAVKSVVSEIKSGDFNNDSLIAVDDSHAKFSKVYILDAEDVD